MIFNLYFNNFRKNLYYQMEYVKAILIYTFISFIVSIYFRNFIFIYLLIEGLSLNYY
jgi:hypothetical protein